jgi:hypothetical protein
MKTAEALLLLRGDIELEILARNEYLTAENEILKSKLKTPVHLTNPERIRLAQIGKRIGLKALKSIACIVKPETILQWFQELVAGKFDGSKNRNYPGRPGTKLKVEKLILEIARNNPDWGYDRIAGTLSKSLRLPNEGRRFPGMILSNPMKTFLPPVISLQPK